MGASASVIRAADPLKLVTKQDLLTRDFETEARKCTLLRYFLRLPCSGRWKFFSSRACREQQLIEQHGNLANRHFTDLASAHIGCTRSLSKCSKLGGILKSSKNYVKLFWMPRDESSKSVKIRMHAFQHYIHDFLYTSHNTLPFISALIWAWVFIMFGSISSPSSHGQLWILLDRFAFPTFWVLRNSDVASLTIYCFTRIAIVRRADFTITRTEPSIFLANYFRQPDPTLCLSPTTWFFFQFFFLRTQNSLYFE